MIHSGIRALFLAGAVGLATSAVAAPIHPAAVDPAPGAVSQVQWYGPGYGHHRHWHRGYWAPRAYWAAPPRPYWGPRCRTVTHFSYRWHSWITERRCW